MTIANYIREDLESRIRSGGNLPSKLTLAALSQHYGVSVTPVRSALEDLIDRQWIYKLDNGRLAVNPHRMGRVEAAPADPEPPKDWDQIITRDVLLQSLSGRGGYLREEAASSKYGIGRTVLRRIFSKLAGAGMLVHEPRRGWRVRVFREKEMRDYIDVRETLELRALELARPRLDFNELKRIRECNVSADQGREARLDNRLHRHWIDRCDNFYIQDFFDRHGPYYTALFEYAAPGAAVTAEMVRQHHAILDGLLARDWDVAEAALVEHIRSQQPALSKMIERLSEDAEHAVVVEAEPLAV